MRRKEGDSRKRPSLVSQKKIRSDLSLFDLTSPLPRFIQTDVSLVLEINKIVLMHSIAHALMLSLSHALMLLCSQSLQPPEQLCTHSVCIWDASSRVFRAPTRATHSALPTPAFAQNASNAAWRSSSGFFMATVKINFLRAAAVFCAGFSERRRVRSRRVISLKATKYTRTNVESVSKRRTSPAIPARGSV